MDEQRKDSGRRSGSSSHCGRMGAYAGGRGSGRSGQVRDVSGREALQGWRGAGAGERELGSRTTPRILAGTTD